MKKDNVKNSKLTLNSLLIIIVMSTLALFPLFTLGVRGKSVTCIATFLVNAILFIWGMYVSQKKNSISMELIYWIFMFFFMYFAPMNQYLLSTFPWHGSFTHTIIRTANLCIFLFNVFFLLGLRFSRNIKVSGAGTSEVSRFICESFEFGKTARFFVSLIVLGLAVYSISKTGLRGIVVSRVNAIQAFYSGNNSAIELIVDSVLPAFIAFSVAEAAQRFVQKKENGLRFLLLCACLLVCFFPTAIPRYKTATIYGTIVLVLLPQLKKGARFFWFFVLAMFFAFPLLNAFRHVISSESVQSVFENGFLSVYVEADYDAYRMLGSALKYYQTNGSTFGKQLFGSLLFFIPRAFWPSKPGGSGAMLIRHEMGDKVPSNVSCPLIAEGLVNFGVIGVVAFGFSLGLLLRKVDSIYNNENTQKENVVFSPYLFLLFMLFFVLRGDLLSGFAYLCGFVATGYALKVVSKYI